MVDQLTSELIDGRISGIMGLAFQGIANTAAPPFWQALVNANLNQLSSPEFSFFITRFVDDAHPLLLGRKSLEECSPLAGQTVPFSMATPTFNPSHLHKPVVHSDSRLCQVSDALRVFRGSSI